MKHYRILSMTAAILMAITTAAYAQDKAPPMSGSEFAQAASMGNEYEILAGQLAVKRSQDVNVQKVAKRIISDHNQSEQKLKSVLASEGNKTPISSRLDAEHRKMYGALKRANDASFNRMYLDDQIMAHNDAIKMFQDYADAGTDTGLRDFASNTLPTLEHHQAMVSDLKVKMTHSVW